MYLVENDRPSAVTTHLAHPGSRREDPVSSSEASVRYFTRKNGVSLKGLGGVLAKPRHNTSQLVLLASSEKAKHTNEIMRSSKRFS